MVPKRVKFITFGIKEGKFGLFLKKRDFFLVLGKLHGNVVFEPRIKRQIHSECAYQKKYIKYRGLDHPVHFL